VCSIVLTNLHEWRERGAGKEMVRMREDRGCCEGAAQDHPIYVHICMLQACMPNDCKNSLQFRLTEMRRSFCARCLIALCSTYFR